MAKPTVSLKLLIDTNGKRVLFAEVGKDCVDFLFHILSLPVATVIGLLREQRTVSSLTNLYESIENLNDSYIQPNQTKKNLLNPLVSAGSSVPLLALKGAPTVKKFFRCGNCTYVHNVTDDQRAVCPNCRSNMATNLSYVAPPGVQQTSGGGEGGFVKGVVTYMVMDDLVVTPMSTILSITLLNKFNVKDVRSLEEKVVHLGMDEAPKLLNATLHSKNVLTDVFLSSIYWLLQVEEY